MNLILKEKKPKRTSRIIVYVQDELKNKLQIYCRDKDESESSVVNKLLRDLLK